MARVERLVARVTLDDPAPTVERAEARAQDGDESWERWVAEYRRGEAIIVRLAVSLQVSDGADELTVEAANLGVFLEADPHPPRVEQQVAELISKDFPALTRELALRGHRLAPDALHDMYVHVELGEDVRASLTTAAASHDQPEGDARLSRHENRPTEAR